MTCRRLERRWCRSRLTSDYHSYTDQRTVVKNTTIVFKSKMDYYSSLIYSAESDSKTLFPTITRLLHRKADKLFPTSSSAVDLANKSVHFIEGKIVNIRSNLVTPVIPDFFRTLDTSSLTCQLLNLAPISNTELWNIANNIMKSCILIWIRFPPPYCSSTSSYFYQLSSRLSTCHWNPVIFRLL